MDPHAREKLKMTLLTPFTKKRASWAHSICINTHDGKNYSLDGEIPRIAVIYWPNTKVTVTVVSTLAG
jgi:hypothetical protein